MAPLVEAINNWGELLVAVVRPDTEVRPFVLRQPFYILLQLHHYPRGVCCQSLLKPRIFEVSELGILLPSFRSFLIYFLLLSVFLVIIFFCSFFLPSVATDPCRSTRFTDTRLQSSVVVCLFVFLSMKVGFTMFLMMS